LQPDNELSGEGSREIPPTDDVRLTVVDWVWGDEYYTDIGVVSWVDYKCNNGKGLMSINGTPLKVMFRSGEEWGRRGSLI